MKKKKAHRVLRHTFISKFKEEVYKRISYLQYPY